MIKFAHQRGVGVGHLPLQDVCSDMHPLLSSSSKFCSSPPLCWSFVQNHCPEGQDIGERGVSWGWGSMKISTGREETREKWRKISRKRSMISHVLPTMQWLNITLHCKESWLLVDGQQKTGIGWSGKYWVSGKSATPQVNCCPCTQWNWNGTPIQFHAQGSDSELSYIAHIGLYLSDPKGADLTLALLFFLFFLSFSH